MRGLPGSGKTYTARHLAGRYGRLFCSDDWMVDELGNYKYDRNKLLRAKYECFEAFKRALRQKTEIVINHNCNLVIRSYQPYIDEAEALGYLVIIVQMPLRPFTYLAERNVHGVPIEMIATMARSWETDLRGTTWREVI